MKRWFLFLLLFSPTGLSAQSPHNVLLVLNESSPASLDIGQYYAQKRGVPPDNLLRLRVNTGDEISRADYDRQIETPIASWMIRNAAQDRILYLVLTKGIPLRVRGSEGADGTVASVDSELTLLYRKMTGIPVALSGRTANPYFLGSSPIGSARRFTHKDYDIFLVSRLDGYTSADARGLVDRAQHPAKEGKILLDATGPTVDKGNEWLQRAAQLLGAMGLRNRVILETTGNALQKESDVLGYYSWGSNDPGIRRRNRALSFVPGALAGMFVSSDARTFAEPPADWNVGPWDDRSPKFAGSPQSLSGDLIREGVTGVAGHVAEPFLESTIRPDVLFPAYLSGFSLIESFYLAMPYLSWQTVVVGDPLCSPFASSLIPSTDSNPDIDSGTELPAFFSSRRFRTLSMVASRRTPARPGAIRAMMRAEVRMAREDTSGARQALEEATSLDSRLAGAQQALALIYEQTGEYDKAIGLYRLLIEWNPENAIALNNLAYGLAVRQGNPRDALPFADRAYKLAKDNPNITDTLGWIRHLAGSDGEAYPLLQQAVESAPGNAEVQLHAAVVAASLGRPAEAAKYLARALELDPKLENREEAREVRTKLNAKP